MSVRLGMTVGFALTNRSLKNSFLEFFSANGRGDAAPPLPEIKPESDFHSRRPWRVEAGYRVLSAACQVHKTVEATALDLDARSLTDVFVEEFFHLRIQAHLIVEVVEAVGFLLLYNFDFRRTPGFAQPVAE